MPRRPRNVIPGLPLHIVQRGNDRRRTFRRSVDFRCYLAALRETSDEYGVDVHAFALMPNHVHLLVTPATSAGASSMMQQLGRKYVSWYNKTYDRTGTLWEGRFRSSVVASERYLFACYRYIELNPVRAGLAKNPEDYLWSSYRENALFVQQEFLKPRPEYLALGSTSRERRRRYQGIFTGTMIGIHDDTIRHALKKGIPTI